MQSQTKANDNYAFLKDQIVKGVYDAEQKLLIHSIAKERGSSLGGIREALSRLASDGLVVYRPQRGYVVSPFSRRDLQDLATVRIEVETACLRNSIENGSLEWESQVMSAWHRLSRLGMSSSNLDLGTNDERAAAHIDFHDALISACGNRWWLQLREHLFIHIERYRRSLYKYVTVDRNSNDEHKQIMDAALSYDRDYACILLARHLQKTIDLIMSLPNSVLK